MRCKNCGWENETGCLKCEKCNAPLKGSMVEPNCESDKVDIEDATPEQGTISESQIFGNPKDGQCGQTCPKCGYPVSPTMTTCPACGTSIQQGKREDRSAVKKCMFCGNEIIPDTKFCGYCGKPVRMGTVNSGPAANPGTYFTLKALPWENEHVQYHPMTFCGEYVELNRGNTDPNNHSITSKVQAVIKNENGKWYIEDKSDFHSTYVRVSRQVELHPGDVIVLGNRLFEFIG